ncbi:zinc finger family protein [Plasmopara halstedii]|uniref:RING-type E3 ubiquitin transferase n=1 Tax=Plasmopara halstedii TaxID=4781 RepID=A0A0P1AAC3_PLAHL|nr:zinc finger family protein [Plasmopara halstedii]CEG37306.1 zinc finger family protein [Plasmopara halstedii]|eukprot:XP_024573675.1 zinc finger family protein [Plasmopara halstedii]
MASFDDLAFIRPPDDNTTASLEFFCRDCNEVSQTRTPDGRRCLICGCVLERRYLTEANERVMPNAVFGSRAASVEELQTMVMRLLSQIGDDWNGGDADARRPASDEAVKNLGSFSADQASTIEVAIVVKGIKGEAIAIPGNFGPCESLKERKVILADPFDGARAFQNSDDMKNKIVVMARGGCTFAQKVLRAQAAGAAGVIIIQNVDVWPYTMTDSTGESKNVIIPAFMMSAKVGEGFATFIRTQSEEDILANVIVRKNARECVICQGEMVIGVQVTRMPCQHMFHTTCLHEWLQIGNSCPICRVKIAAKRNADKRLTTSQNAQQRGDFAWSEWFS